MTTTGGDIVEELRQRGADSTLIPNNAYVRTADEIERLRARVAMFETKYGAIHD